MFKINSNLSPPALTGAQPAAGGPRICFLHTPTHLLLLLVGGSPPLAVLVKALAAAPRALSAKQGFELHHFAADH